MSNAIRVLSTKYFARRAKRAKLAESDLRMLEGKLAGDPEAGDVIPGLGGARKLRFPIPSRRIGTRGGVRIIHYYVAHAGDVWLLDVYAKSDQSDLDPEQTKRVQRAIGELEAAYE